MTEVGTLLERRYRVDAFIGRGETGGRVFRGHDVVSGAPVAVRCPGIPTALKGLAFEEAIEAFLAEAKTLVRASQTSDDIEKLLAYGITETSTFERMPYCVFEWLEGSSLEQHIAERPPGSVLSLGEALAILEPAARGLAAVHAVGIAHRDVRPRNLWLASIGGRTRMKITQFALASRLGPTDDAFAPEYGAPEHFKRSYGALGPATDVYGLALCLVELVSGRRALEGRDPAELYLATSDLARRPTLRARGVHVPDAVEAILARALAVDLKRRWQNTRELWDALVAAVPELTPGSPSVRPAPDETMKPPSAPARVEPERSRPDRTALAGWAVAIVATLAVAIVSIRLATRRPRVHAVPHSAAPSATTAPSNDETAVHLAPFLTDMIRVPPGTFTMGTDRAGRGDGPAHAVQITKPFYIDRTEVTAEAYWACVEDGSCTPNRVHADNLPETALGCNTGKDRPRHPVNCIDRAQAEKYCAYVQKRLPTEAEWEYAARSADGRDYPWGNAPPTKCTMAVVFGLPGECRERKSTSEVGTTADGRSPFGALDMAGNVWEWVADGHVAYTHAPATDPRAPLEAPHARGILRGGSWDYAPTSATTYFRFPFQANIGNISTGFRCARD